MNSNSSLEQYKKIKIAELNGLRDTILNYNKKLYGSGPNGTGMYKNAQWLPYNFNRDVYWIIDKISTICENKKDVDTAFNWKEAEYKQMITVYKKRERKQKGWKINPGTEKPILTANNHAIADNEAKYTNKVIDDYKLKYLEIQYKAHEKLMEERRKIREARKAAKNAQAKNKKTLKTNTGLVSTASRVNRIRSSTASARAAVKSTAALSAKASSVPPAPPLPPTKSNPTGSTRSVGRFTVVPVNTVEGKKVRRRRSAKKKRVPAKKPKKSSRRSRRI